MRLLTSLLLAGTLAAMTGCSIDKSDTSGSGATNNPNGGTSSGVGTGSGVEKASEPAGYDPAPGAP